MKSRSLKGFTKQWSKHLGVLTLLVAGMGGSHLAADILTAARPSIDMRVHKDYGLPELPDIAERLIIASSYSGNTEETLSAIDAAKKIEAKIIGVTTGGKIAELIKSGEIAGTIIDPGVTNPTNFPKTGLGVSFGALSGTLAKIGILKRLK